MHFLAVIWQDRRLVALCLHQVLAAQAFRHAPVVTLRVPPQFSAQRTSTLGSPDGCLRKVIAEQPLTLPASLLGLLGHDWQLYQM